MTLIWHLMFFFLWKTVLSVKEAGKHNVQFVTRSHPVTSVHERHMMCKSGMHIYIYITVELKIDLIFVKNDQAKHERMQEKKKHRHDGRSIGVASCVFSGQIIDKE